MKPIQFDVDGVLANFLAGYDAVCREVGLTPPSYDAPWDSRLAGPVWQRIRESWTFWYSLPSLASPYEFLSIESLQSHRPCYFVTNRVGKDAKGQTEAWLIRQGISNPTVVISGEKGAFARLANIGYAIDDKAGNAVAISYLSRDTVSVLIDRPYNRLDHNVIGGSVKRVKNVSEFLQLVREGE